MNVEPGLYKHYKGGKYNVHFVAKDEATLEDVVVYESVKHNSVSKFWVRKKDIFCQDVDMNGKKVKRFTRLIV